MRAAVVDLLVRFAKPMLVSDLKLERGGHRVPPRLFTIGQIALLRNPRSHQGASRVDPAQAAH
jgi:hypothetical protein